MYSWETKLNTETKKNYSIKAHKEDIKICVQLGYPREFIERIKEEEDEDARQRMMRDARRKY